MPRKGERTPRERIARQTQSRVDRYKRDVEQARKDAHGDPERFAELLSHVRPYIDHTDCSHADDVSDRQRCIRRALILIGTGWSS